MTLGPSYPSRRAISHLVLCMVLARTALLMGPVDSTELDYRATATLRAPPPSLVGLWELIIEAWGFLYEGRFST